MGAASINSTHSKTLRVVHRQRDWGTSFLFLLVLVLLVSAIGIYAYPWADLTYRYGQAAVPERPLPERPLAASITNWCVDLNPYAEARQVRTPLRDDGTAGDRVAGDGIYSLQTQYARAGIHYWHVAACDSPGINFPEAPAWLWTAGATEHVVLMFDTNRYTEGEAGKQLPVSFITNASGQVPPLYVFGSVNDWKRADEVTRLQKVRDGKYRLVYSVPTAGTYTAAVVFEDDKGGLHGFMSDGRTESWNLLKFRTQRDDEIVVFEVDTELGRSAILYDVSPVFAWVALKNGRNLVSLVLGALALALTFLALKRYQLLRRPDLHAEAGCPACGSVTLLRLPRTRRMRLARFVGLNTGFFECSQCPWHGTRLIGGNKTEVLHGSQFMMRFLPILAPLVLLVVSGTTAVFLRSELGHSPSMSTAAQVNSARVFGESEALQTQLSAETHGLLSNARSWLAGLGFPAATLDKESSDGTTAVTQPAATRAAEAGGFSPIQYDARPATGEID